LLGAGIGLAIILWAAGCSTIGTLPDGIPWPTNTAGTVTTTTTTTTTQPPVVDSGIKLSWSRGGVNHSGAVRDERVTITSARVAGATFYYTGTGLETWPLRSFNPDGNINAVFCIFFDGDGDGAYERGGKIDWARSNARERPLGPHLAGYSNWDGAPKRGTPWAALLTDEKGKYRSNIVTGEW